MRSLVSIFSIIILSGCNDLLIQQHTSCSDAPYNWKFIHISDIHIGTDKGAENFQALIPVINEMSPDFVINTGDTSNDAEFDLALGLEQWSQFNNMAADLTVPLYNTPGNHDLGWTTDPTTRDAYNAAVGPLNTEFTHKNIKFILSDDIPAKKSMAAILPLTSDPLFTIRAVHIPVSSKNLGDMHVMAGHLHQITATKNKLDGIEVTAPAIKDHKSFLIYFVRDHEIEVCSYPSFHRVTIMERP